jgi:hypothetical protein
MKYQDCAAPAQAPERIATGGGAGDLAACDANINPHTGLATDYLNHFNEAAMLLEMLSSAPDCLEDFLAWRPMSYREHFAASRFKGRDTAIAAYEAADPRLRASLDGLTGTMTAMLKATRAALTSDIPHDAAGEIAGHAAAWLKPLIARAGALINGESGAAGSAPQAVVDGLMSR